jgi:ferredoxin
MLGLTFDNLGGAVFTTDFRAFRTILRRATEAITRLNDDANKDANKGRADPASARELEEAAAELDAFVQRLINQRRAAPTSGRDVLAVLIEAAARADAVFNNRWVRDETVTLIPAGHETTAFASTMACWLLASHPEVSATLRVELRAASDRACPPSSSPTRSPSPGTWSRRPCGCTRRCRPCTEQRCRTWRRAATGSRQGPSWCSARGRCSATAAVPDPLAFDPWRFAGERRRALPRDAYLPFGAGPRICAGNHFALLEAAVIVAMTALHTRLEPLDEREPALVEIGTTLRCGPGLRVRAHRTEETEGAPVSGRLRVAVDAETCIGAGQCELFCPEVFEVRDGLSHVKVSEPPESLRDAVLDAADACTSQAIQVDEA